MEINFELELPPSINKAFVFNPRIHALARTNEYHEYTNYAYLIIKNTCRKNKIKPINKFTVVKLYFYLKDKRTDSHNLKKILFDCMEKGGLFENDKYILDRTIFVKYDKKKPRIEIGITINKNNAK